MGVGLGAIGGAIIGGYIASRMTQTPANKRILYSGAIQVGLGFLLRKKWPGVALGMIGSGCVNLVAVGFSAAPNALLDGQKFTTTALPAPEAASMTDIPAGATITPATY
jgi:hypothetical protein